MSKMQKRKGKDGELELARLLREQLGEQVTRNLEQAREGGADLIGTPFVLEVKRAATANLSEWWRQAEEQAVAGDGIPCLAYRIDYQKWQFILPLGAIHSGFDPKNACLTVTMGLSEFVAVTREQINEKS